MSAKAIAYFNAIIQKIKVMPPIRKSARVSETCKKAKLTPTAKASILVAIAKESIVLK